MLLLPMVISPVAGRLSVGICICYREGTNTRYIIPVFFPLGRTCCRIQASPCPIGTLPSAGTGATSARTTWWGHAAPSTWTPSAPTPSSLSGGSSAKAWKTTTPSAPSATVSQIHSNGLYKRHTYIYILNIYMDLIAFVHGPDRGCYTSSVTLSFELTGST